MGDREFEYSALGPSRYQTLLLSVRRPPKLTFGFASLIAHVDLCATLTSLPSFHHIPHPTFTISAHSLPPHAGQAARQRACMGNTL